MGAVFLHVSNTKFMTNSVETDHHIGCRVIHTKFPILWSTQLQLLGLFMFVFMPVTYEIWLGRGNSKQIYRFL